MKIPYIGAPQSHTTLPQTVLIVGGLLLAGLGAAYLPWIWPRPVALQLTGPSLAEFVKFLDVARTGEAQIERLAYLYPLFLVLLALPLFIANNRLPLRAELRWLVRLGILPLAFVVLSPVWTPDILLNAEFRTQTLVALSGVGLAILGPLTYRLPFSGLAALLIILSLPALWLPYQQFALVHNALERAYLQSVTLSAGWWVMVVGFLLTDVGCGWWLWGRFRGFSVSVI